MKMFSSKKCQADVMLIVQTPHKTFMIKYYDNNLKIFFPNSLLQILFQIQVNEALTALIVLLYIKMTYY